jgi:diguanylate cyclase (GGDEF)-like protein
MDAEYARWMERNATTTGLIYCGIIAVFLPAFHFVLAPLPGVPPGSDSLALRCLSAAVSLAIAAALIVVRPLRRHAADLQLLNVLVAVTVIAMLVVNSGDHYAYIASAFLVIIGAQQAFYRWRALAVTFAVGFGVHILYSAQLGVLTSPMNIAALVTFGAGYVIGFVPAVLRMRIQQREIWNRLEAQRVKEQLQDVHATLLRMARFDSLTGLPNRSTVQNILSEEIRRAEAAGTSCAVAFIDLDRFKDVNDTLGHEVGDRLLRDVARRLANTLGQSGVLARWGGDEFIAIIPDVHDESIVAALAAGLVHVAGEAFTLDDVDLTVTASVGIAMYPRDGLSAVVLIRNADAAMYNAKQELGCGFAFFSDALHTAAASRHNVRSALRRALADDDLVLHYQPIVDAGTRSIVAAEALVRWNGSDGRLRMPSEFIGVAEDSRIIVPLGTWVLNAACRQAARWRSQGRDIVVALNVSPRQIAHPDFVETLADALRTTGVLPGSIEIEITEAAIMANVESVIGTLEAVHAMGVRVAIDDFGAGYSSFAYLKRFKVGSLKIDRTFVEGIEQSDNLAIATAIVSVAHALRLPATAEGVETEAQARLLADLGCERLQGYLFGRPLPVEEFERRLPIAIPA